MLSLEWAAVFDKDDKSIEVSPDGDTCRFKDMQGHLRFLVSKNKTRLLPSQGQGCDIKVLACVLNVQPLARVAVGFGSAAFFLCPDNPLSQRENWCIDNRGNLFEYGEQSVACRELTNKDVIVMIQDTTRQIMYVFVNRVLVRMVPNARGVQGFIIVSSPKESTTFSYVKLLHSNRVKISLQDMMWVVQ